MTDWIRLIKLTMHVRSASAADICRVVTVYRASRREAFRDLVPAEAVLPRIFEEDVKRWSQFAEVGNGHLFVGEISSQIIGMAALEYCGPVAELGALYVHPLLYRAGAGSALLWAALSAARADSHQQLCAWVLATNQPAKSFFLARGGWLDGGVEIRQSAQSAKLTMQRIRFNVHHQEGSFGSGNWPQRTYREQA